MQFFLVNKSSDSSITPIVVAQIAAACAVQLARDFAPFWQMAAIPVGVAGPNDPLPADACVVSIVDTLPDAPGALGYHDLNSQSRPEALIGWGPIRDSGGTLTTGSNSLSVCISHEILEAARDPYANWWCDMVGIELALETCDPVEDTSYNVQLPGNYTVSVSNFVGPRYFDPQGAGPWDFMNLLTGPFTMTRGGYQIQRSDGPTGTVNDVFARTSEDGGMPEWKRAVKRLDVSRRSVRHKGSSAHCPN